MPTAKPPADTPMWLTPGEPVVVIHTHFSGGRRHIRNVESVRIHRVATKSFTVTGSSYRFRIDNQRYNLGGFNRSILTVLPADSAEARLADQTVNNRDRFVVARTAFESWTRDRTRTNRLAAIAALEAVQDDSGMDQS